MSKAVSHLVFSCVLLTMLSACGWQLRGSVPTDSNDSDLQHPAEPTETVTNPTLIVNDASPKVVEPAKQAQTTPHIDAKAVSINFVSPSPEIETALRFTMQQLQLREASNAARKITIYRERTEKRPLVYSETGVALRYQLIMSVDYAVEDHQGKSLIPRRTIMRWRNYDFDATQIAATVQEEKILRSELSGELARQIINAY